MSVNKVTLVGRAGTDPEVREFDNGDKIVNLPLATSFSYTNRETEERVEETEWHRLVFRGGRAKVAEQYIKKGTQIYVEGRIKTRKYTDEAGVERYPTEIIVEELTLLGSKDDNNG